MIVAVLRILLLFSLVFLSACERKPAAYHEQLLVFGTVVEVSLFGVSEQQGLKIQDRQLFLRCGRLYGYRPFF